MLAEMEDIKSIMTACAEDSAVWCKTLFPQIFRRPFSPKHIEALKALDNPYLQKVLWLCHRGFGKSSLMQVGYMSKALCLGLHNSIVPCSATASLAIEKSELLKAELCGNTTLMQLFGQQKSDRWSREEWYTNSGVRVIPRGAGQQVRGLLPRPDFLAPDDLENSENVQSEEQRDKLKSWLFGDFFGCVDLSAAYRICAVGTPLHEDALLMNLAEDPSWYVVSAPLFNEDMESLWPEYRTTEQIRQMAAEWRAQGKIDQFWQEYGLKIISSEDATFKSAFFKGYDEAALQLNVNPNVERMLIVDPAKTVTPHSDDSAIVGLAFNPASNIVYVRDVIAGKLYPEQVFDHIFAMAKRLNTTTVGIEVTSLNEWIVWPFKNEILRRGANIELIELKAKGSKEDRVKALIPLYRQGLVYHNKNVTNKLEQQLLSFPRSAKWDVMDALAYVVSLLNAGDRYMTQVAMDEPEKPIELYGFDPQIEKEFEGLDYEDPMDEGEWMVV